VLRGVPAMATGEEVNGGPSEVLHNVGGVRNVPQQKKGNGSS
jgi:hypothetical protein